MVGQSQVVVGVDGSAGSDLAVRWAADAASVRQLPLRVVHVVEPMKSALPMLDAATPGLT
jgi:nucleotide-binding universal stress UspA family protein